jgi:adenine-specific DNA-methyltransferase
MHDATMQKLTAADLETHSPDLVAENLAALQALFPELITEGPDGVAVNIDVLKALVGDKTVSDADEKYGLNWHGKRRARQLALTPSTGTLRPCPEDSVDWDTTQNLMIEGDNLEVLKLLQKSYAGKVKLIYIDPPYNTGKDFVYPDNFQDNIKNYLELTGQTGEGGRKLSSNTEASGRFHTDWLNMMYPRLKLARNLLREDGVIFISIDDSESDNLRKLCDEIFGSENFINAVTVNMKNIAGASGGGEDKRLKKNVEFCFIYARSYDALTPFKKAYDYIPIEDLVQQYRDEGVSWKYTSVLTNPGEKKYAGATVDGDGNEIRIYARTGPVIKSISQLMREERLSEAETYRKYAKYTFQTAMPQSSIRPRIMSKCQSLGLKHDLYSIEYVPKTGRNKGVVYEQFYKGENFRLFAWLGDVAEEIKGRLFKKELQGTYWNYASETKNLTKEGDTPFPNGKKPLALLHRLLELDGDTDAVILDFFAGSGTSGHAVMARNVIEEANRRFILVQMPEPLHDDDDQTAAIQYCDSLSKPRTIAELTKERLRRSGKKIREDNPLFAGDLGFRVFKLDSTNILEWDPDRDKIAETLEASIEHLKTERTEQDILFELLLKLGLDLCVPIDTQKVEGSAKQIHDLHSIGGGSLLICLSKSIPQVDVELVALALVSWHQELKPAGDTTVVFRDSAFADDVAKTNITAILWQHGLETVRSL